MGIKAGGAVSARKETNPFYADTKGEMPQDLMPEDPLDRSDASVVKPEGKKKVSGGAADPLVRQTHVIGEPLTYLDKDDDGLIPTREAPGADMGGRTPADGASGRTRGFGGPVNIGSLKKPTA